MSSAVVVAPRASTNPTGNVPSYSPFATARMPVSLPFAIWLFTTKVPVPEYRACTISGSVSVDGRGTTFDPSPSMATIRESAGFDVVVVVDDGGGGCAVECLDEHAPSAIAPIAATQRIE